MSSEDDDDLKALRTALLSSIRGKKKTTERSHEIYDTDIDDLDALRNAALKSVKPDVKSVNNALCFPSQSLRPTSLCHQFAANSSVSPMAAHQPRLPTFRLRPPPFQPRSNLILIRTVPEETDATTTSSNVASTSTSSPQLILPQDRYLKNNFTGPTEKIKRSDKWARFEEDSSSSESDAEEETTTTMDETNLSRSDESEEEIVAENDEDSQSEECAGRVSPPQSNNSGREEKEEIMTESPSKNEEEIHSPSPTPPPSTFTEKIVEKNSNIVLFNEKNSNVQMKKQPMRFDDDLFLEEPADTIEFLDDEPMNYEAIMASLNKKTNAIVDDNSQANVGTENDSVSSSSSSKVNDEKKQLKSKLNEVERKLAELYRGGDRHRRRDERRDRDRERSDDHRRRTREDSTSRKRRRRRSSSSDDRKRRHCREIDGRNELTSSRPSPVVVLSSSVVAVRKKDADEKEKLSPPKSSRRKQQRHKNNIAANNNFNINNSEVELRETLLRKSALPSLFELKVVNREQQQGKINVGASMSSTTKKENSPTKIIGKKGDLRDFLTSKKTSTSSGRNNNNSANTNDKSKTIKLRKEKPPQPTPSVAVVDARHTRAAKKIRLDNFPITFVNDSATKIEAKSTNAQVTKEDFASSSSQKLLIRRIVVDNKDNNDKDKVVGDKVITTNVRKTGGGNSNRTLFDSEVHVQWKKSGAEPVKEGKSTGGKIKLKRP